MAEPLRWGVIGASSRIYRGKILPPIEERAGHQVVAEASRTPDGSDAPYAELLRRDDVDAVYIPLPNDGHRRWILAALGVLLVVAVLAIGWIGSRGLVDTRGVEPALLLLLVAGYAVRALADFRAMLLHASMRERLVFRSQCVALAAAVVLYFALGALIGLPGIAIGLILASTVFLALLSCHVRRSPDLRNDGETARA